MQPLEFKRKLKETKWRKYFYARGVAIITLSIIIGLLSWSIERWWNPLLLIGVSLLYLLSEYRFLTWMDQRRQRWETFKLTITDDRIIREFCEERDEILKSEIKSIVQERDGGLRINGDDGIWTPRDVDKFELIEKALLSDSAFDSDSKVKIDQESPIESFQSFIEILQKNFGGASVFTIIIIPVVTLNYTYTILYTE